MTRKRVSERRLAAYHEAGHTIVALATGLRVHEIFVCDPGHPDPTVTDAEAEATGATCHGPVWAREVVMAAARNQCHVLVSGPWSDTAVRSRLVLDIAERVAGPVAEALVRGVDPHQLLPGFGDANEVLELLLCMGVVAGPGVTVSDEAGMAAESTLRYTHQLHAALRLRIVREAERLAESILRRQWRAVRSVARQVDRRGSISSIDVDVFAWFEMVHPLADPVWDHMLKAGRVVPRTGRCLVGVNIVGSESFVPMEELMAAWDPHDPDDEPECFYVEPDPPTAGELTREQAARDPLYWAWVDPLHPEG